MNEGLVIAGGGLAAQRCCETLRRGGYEQPIRLVCAEDRAPYDRPPLSKQLLAGTMDAGALAFRDARWYADNGVDLLLGDTASGLDPARRRLRLGSGAELGYEHLLIATGGVPRRLPGAEAFANVHELRSAADAARLRGALRPGSRLLVVGMGFIGQEVAATARGLGVEVTALEAAPAPLAHILGERLGGWFAGMHAEEGVDVVLGTPLARFHGDGRVEEAELADGRRLRCDAVVLGIGVAPATTWLAGSGLPVERGAITVDPSSRTALPGVYAAGDVTGHQHWEAAVRQGSDAARAILGREPGPVAPPYFWSDQYGVRIQCVGSPRGADAVLVEGDQRARDFTAVFHRGRTPVAALLVGRPEAMPAMRRLIAGHPTTQQQRRAA
jgi:3-phenylpropionate/trans-cinnamate dioxygenase ferredoxin reductase component